MRRRPRTGHGAVGEVAGGEPPHAGSGATAGWCHRLPATTGAAPPLLLETAAARERQQETRKQRSGSGEKKKKERGGGVVGDGE
jgi:hypothetical protein